MAEALRYLNKYLYLGNWRYVTHASTQCGYEKNECFSDDYSGRRVWT